jgi:hypothetical protein
MILQTTFRRRCRGKAILVAICMMGAPAAAADPPPDDPPASVVAPDSGALRALRVPQPNPVASGRVWMPIGPAAIAGGQVENVTPATVSGAVHALAPHPLDADVLYIGAVNGGVWKTTNATAWSPSFVPLTDDLPSLSISEVEFDPTDPAWQTLVAGTGRQSALSREGGPEIGIFRTTDGGVSWAVLGPEGAGTCTGVVARGATLVAGFSGAGVLRSTDAGATWQGVSGAGSGLPAGRVMDLVADPVHLPVLYAALAQAPEAVGIFRSDDTGANWARVSDPAIDAKISLITFNIEMAVGRSGEVWLGIVNAGQVSGIFRSADRGATWIAMDLPFYPVGEPQAVSCVVEGRPVLIVAPHHGLVTGDRVRIDGVTGTTAANGLWRVGNATEFTFGLYEVDFPFAPQADNVPWTGGGVWQQLVDINPRFRNQESPAAQGQIHFAIQADPDDPDVVYVGGDRQDDPFPNFIGARSFTGALLRGDASVEPTGGAPSPQWEHLTHSDAIAAIPGGGTASSSAPHADSRDLEFDAAGDLLLGDDGGLFRRTSPRDNRGDWFGMSGDLAITEMHSVAWDPVARVAFGGTQDNGTVAQRSWFDPVWDFLSGGDGGRVAVQAAGGRSIRYTSAQQLLVARRTEFDADNIMLAESFLGLALVGPGEPIAVGALAPFYVPWATNAVAADRLLIASQNLYESFDRGDTLAQVLDGATFGADLVYGGRRGGVDNPDVVWAVQRRAGDPNRFVVRVRETLAGGFVDTPAGYPGVDGVEAMAVDPDDWGRLATVEANRDGAPRVYLTEDAGGMWVEVTGNLGALTRDPRSLVFVPGYPDMMVAGGLGGAFAMPLDDYGAWVPLGAGMPAVPGYDLVYDPADDVLLAATLGRGAWALEGVSLQQPTGAFVGHGARAPRRGADGDPVEDATLPAPWVVALEDVTFADAAEALVVGIAVGALLPASGPQLPAVAGDRGGYVAYALASGNQSLADPARRPARFARRVVDAVNDLGAIRLHVRRPANLLVPAGIDVGILPAKPPRQTLYLCYDVAPTPDDLPQTPGGMFARDAEVFVDDPIVGADCGTIAATGLPRFPGTSAAGHCLVRLLRPRQLCNPVALDAVGAELTTAATGVERSLPRSEASLLCYRARVAAALRSEEAAVVVGAVRGDRIQPPQAGLEPRRVRDGSGFLVSPGAGFPAPRRIDTNVMFDVCLPTSVTAD